MKPRTIGIFNSSIKPTSLRLKQPLLDFQDNSALFGSSIEYYQSIRNPPVFADPTCLPQTPTDIKGVDASVYQHLRNNRFSKLIPTVTNNKYFSLKYYPSNHYISMFRKSTIAYTFTNKGGYKLNDQTLEAALQDYKGKYRNDTFFKENLQPLETSFGRIQYRRFIKKCLFDSIWKTVSYEQELPGRTNIESISPTDIKKLSGVFRFTFLHVPKTTKEKEDVLSSMQFSLKRILNDSKYQKELQRGTEKSNLLKKEIKSLMHFVNNNETKANSKAYPFMRN